MSGRPRVHHRLAPRLVERRLRLGHLEAHSVEPVRPRLRQIVDHAAQLADLPHPHRHHVARLIGDDALRLLGAVAVRLIDRAQAELARLQVAPRDPGRVPGCVAENAGRASRPAEGEELEVELRALPEHREQPAHVARGAGPCLHERRDVDPDSHVLPPSSSAARSTASFGSG